MSQTSPGYFNPAGGAADCQFAPKKAGGSYSSQKALGMHWVSLEQA